MAKAIPGLAERILELLREENLRVRDLDERLGMDLGRTTLNDYLRRLIKQGSVKAHMGSGSGKVYRIYSLVIR